jgi:hypothetical protein
MFLLEKEEVRNILMYQLKTKYYVSNIKNQHLP